MNKAQTMEKTKETKAYKYKPSGIEWLGDIPEHWEVKSGLSAFTNKKIKNTGLKEETVLSLSYGKIVIKPKEKLHGLVPESFETYQLVDIGNIIIRVMDLQNDKVSLRVGLAKDKGIITSAYLCLQVTEQIIYQYGFYLLHAYDLMKIFYGMGSGLRQNLDYRDIKRMPVLIPPIEEQNEIAQYLDYKTKQINRFIKNKQKLIKLLKEQKQNIINQAVTNGTNRNVQLKPSGIEWLGDIPEHWKHTTIRRVSKVYSGGTPSRNNLSYWENGSIPWIPSGYVNKRQIHGSEYFISNLGFTNSSAKWIPKGSLVIALAGQGKTKGMVATVEEPVTCNQSLGAIVPTNKGLNYEFLAYYLESKYRNIRGLVGDDLRDGLNLEYVKSIPLPLPSIEEQKVIVEYIEKETVIIDKAIERTEREIELIKEYKTTLISEVVTGKLPPSRLLGGNLEEIEINDEEIESEENLDEELVEREEEETN